MVLAAMVEDLFSDQNLIDVIPRNPWSGEMIVNRYSSIVRAMPIVGWSAVTTLLDPRDSWVCHRESHASQNDHLSFSINRGAWGDGTQSVVSIPEVGNGSLLWRGINRRSAVVGALIEDEGRCPVHFTLQAV